MERMSQLFLHAQSRSSGIEMMFVMSRSMLFVMMSVLLEVVRYWRPDHPSRKRKTTRHRSFIERPPIDHFWLDFFVVFLTVGCHSVLGRKIMGACSGRLRGNQGFCQFFYIIIYNIYVFMSIYVKFGKICMRLY